MFTDASIPEWLVAGLWGLASGLALLIGALVGYFTHVSQKIIALIMGFGAGVLISALSFELMDEAYAKGGLLSTTVGFFCGGIAYTILNNLLSNNGAGHRKRSQDQQPSEKHDEGSGLAIAAGALLDGIPEAIAIGVSMIEGGVVSVATVIAVFISNVPEAMSSTSGMKHAGRSKQFIFGVWTLIALATAVAAFVGFSVFSDLSKEIMAATLAVAGGAILCMLADTMIPEAFEKGHAWVGLATLGGFLVAFMLTKIR